MTVYLLTIKCFLFHVYVFVCAYVNKCVLVCGFAVSQTSMCVCNCRVGGGGGGDLVSVGHGSLVEIKPP